jgi:hypothetical protein
MRKRFVKVFGKTGLQAKASAIGGSARWQAEPPAPPWAVYLTMDDLTRLSNNLDPATGICRAIIETPKGRRNEFDYDPDSNLFKLGGLLPEGMMFPF